MTDSSSEVIPPPDGTIVVEVDPDLMGLIPTFMENRRKDVARIRDAVAAGDAKALEDIGHSLKGLGGGFGFDYVSTVGRGIEALGREGRLAGAEPWLVALEDYLRRVSPVRGTRSESED